jgi:hypothetical protein
VHGLEREASGAEETPACSRPMDDEKCEKLQARMVQLRGIFDSLDTEGTGVLNQEQLKEAMNRLGFKCVFSPSLLRLSLRATLHSLLWARLPLREQSSGVYSGWCVFGAYGCTPYTPTVSQHGTPEVSSGLSPCQAVNQQSFKLSKVADSHVGEHAGVAGWKIATRWK